MADTSLPAYRHSLLNSRAAVSLTCLSGESRRYITCQFQIHESCFKFAGTLRVTQISCILELQMKKERDTVYVTLTVTSHTGWDWKFTEQASLSSTKKGDNPEAAVNRVLKKMVCNLITIHTYSFTQTQFLAWPRCLLETERENRPRR